MVCGREFSGQQLERLRAEVRDRPELSRSKLARDVCDWLEWKRPGGKRQEVSCRIALLKLERRGLISLPKPQGKIPCPQPPPAWREPSRAPIRASIKELGRLSLVVVTSATAALNAEWKELMAHHYLGAGPLVGAQLRYLVRSEKGWVGALAFSAGAWQVAARDQWIGWSPQARKANLRYAVSNSRFLIPPWVQVPQLASKILSLCVRGLPGDWEVAYGYRPVLLETYIERGRFSGTCYRAANWEHVGRSRGRGRQDRTGKHLATVKDVYVFPLSRRWKSVLCEEPCKGPRPSRLKGEARDWAEEEFGEASLGDRRLGERLLGLARDFYARPQANVPQACQNVARTKAAYRWLAHKKVKMKEILAPHYEATTRRVAEHRVVLAVQDTTSFNYTTHAALSGVGPIGSLADGPKGVLMHETLAYTVEGLPLGLIDVQLWVREAKDFGKSAKRDKLPIEAKESNKWLTSFRAAASVELQCPQTTVVSVGDREADIYELFVLALSRKDHPKLLVRAEQDRLVAEGQGHLWEHVEKQPICAVQVIEVPRTNKRKARRAVLEVRFAPVELRAPNRKRRLGPVKLWAILAKEVDPPEDAQPLEWMLLTTLEVASAEQALEKLRWYVKRWGIEVFHKTLKSGCRIEERQLATVRRIENCLAIDLVVAWRIVHLTMLGRETPDVPCTVFFEDHEWKALYAFVGRGIEAVPATPPTIREATRMVASLGGFLGRKCDGEPGTKSLWLGLQRLDDISGAWLTFGPDSPLQRAGLLETSPVSRNPRYG